MCIRFAQVTILSHPLWSISQTQVSLLEECSVNEPVENQPFWCGFKFHLRVFDYLFLRSIVTDSTPLLLLECPLHVLNPFLALILFPFFFFWQTKFFSSSNWKEILEHWFIRALHLFEFSKCGTVHVWSLLLHEGASWSVIEARTPSEKLKYILRNGIKGYTTDS